LQREERERISLSAGNKDPEKSSDHFAIRDGKRFKNSVLGDGGRREGRKAVSATERKEGPQGGLLIGEGTEGKGFAFIGAGKEPVGPTSVVVLREALRALRK